MSEEIILSTSTYRDQLAGAISELENVPHAVSEQETCVSEIEKKYQHCENRLNTLSTDTRKARKAYENWRDSHALKLAHKLAGKKEKYASKESEEERLYIEALEREVKEKESFELLQQLRTEAKIAYNDLLGKARQRQSLKAELSALYAQVFGGIYTAFPEHGQLVEEVESTRRRQDEIQTTLSGESHAVELLTRTNTLMGACREGITEAVSYMRWDVWGGDGFGDFTLRNLLNRTQALADQAALLVGEAHDISPSVWNMGRISVMPSALANNSFFGSNYALQYQLRDSMAEVVKAQMRLGLQCEAARNRVICASSQFEQIAELLRNLQEELDSLRDRIFTQIVTLRSNVPTDSPPPYEETNRSADAHGAEDAAVPSTLNEVHRTEPRSS